LRLQDNPADGWEWAFMHGSDHTGIDTGDMDAVESR
jgi:hypothetical protein